MIRFDLDPIIFGFGQLRINPRSCTKGCGISAFVWTVVVLAVFAWSHRGPIAAWFTALR